jgi:hypothetical protein
MARVVALAQRAVWELRRSARAFMRRFGAAGVVAGAGALVALCAAAWEHVQLKQLQDLQVRSVLQQSQGSALVVNAPRDDDRTRLAAFDAYLLAHEDIPTVLQDLLQTAEAQGLLLARGDYRAQPDDVGRFVRYRMTMPVKGNIAAVRRFMQLGLQQHKSLALESVQISRERIESSEVQARIQWSVLVRLPASRTPGAAPAALKTADAQAAR